MALEVLRGVSPESACSYLPEEMASLEYRYQFEMESAKYEQLLARGWRRQGACFFRPRCPTCRKCRSLRVLVGDFAPSKSQRRCLKRNADLRLVVRSPRMTKEHLQVFDAYHADMQQRRGWSYSPTKAAEYAQTFLLGSFSFASEFAYYHKRRLVAVGLVDLTPAALSSIYFYHAPELRSQGLGTFSVLQEIEFARQTGRKHLYLGYWIAENASMQYKNRYQPHEILTAQVDDDVEPNWTRPEPTAPHQSVA